MYGFINREGDIVIPLGFIVAEDFEGGLCYVETLKDVGYINSSGEFVWKRPYAKR
jgi:WG repeat protein